jgi:hypothetical protein
MPGRCEEGIAEVFLLVGLQERGRKPGRLVAVQDLPRFLQIARPEYIGFGGTRAVVGKHDFRELPEASTHPRDWVSPTSSPRK